MDISTASLPSTLLAEYDLDANCDNGVNSFFENLNSTMLSKFEGSKTSTKRQDDCDEAGPSNITFTKNYVVEKRAEEYSSDESIF